MTASGAAGAFCKSSDFGERRGFIFRSTSSAFLVGDAAHVNNPLGGLGLNFGIHDAIELTGLLSRVLHHEATVETLDLYDRRRRPLNIEFVQQQTIANKRRMEEKDPVARARNFDELAATAADPAAHRAYLLRASLLDSVRDSARVAA